MNKKNSAVKAAAFISVAAVIFLTIVNGILFYLLLNDDFNYKIQHFSLKSTYLIPFILTLVLSLVISLIPLFIFGKNYKIADNTKTNINALKIFTSTLASLLMIIYSVYNFFFDPTVKSSDTLEILVFIFGIMSGIYFLLSTFSNKTKFSAKTPVIIFLAMSPVFWSITSMLSCYFDKAIAINSPLKSMMLISYAGLIVYFTEDIRRYLSSTKPSIEYFTKLLGTAALGGNAIGRLAVCLIDNSKFSFSVFSSFLLLSLWLLILSSLASLPSSIKPATDDKKASSDEEINSNE